jgi:LCP family protein required for cell wall assembly
LNTYLRKFIYSAAVTFGIIFIVALIAFGVYSGIKSLAKPPTVPTQVVITRPDGGISDIPREENDSQGGEAEMLPPEIIAVMNRKHLFYTFLIFGVDNVNQNADAIIVGAVDIEAREVYTISVPRDLLVDVPRRLRKPTAAYPVGRGGGRGHEGGVEQMYADMQTIFGFRPDFYVYVNTQAFERIVDAVGGVEIHVPFHMRYDDPIDNLRINIPAGTQTLNGTQALHFARYRMSNEGFRAITDYQRMENQQKILRALFDELLTPRTIVRVPELVSIYRENVRTNMTNGEMLWFAGQLNNLVGGNFSTYTLPTSGSSRAPNWYEIPDADAILELINRTVNPFTQEITMDMVRITNE